MTRTSKQCIFGLCQQLPPLFLNPYNANVSSHLKVSCNTLPSTLKRGQKPFCCWGCTGCWLVCRQDRVLVAVMWHRGQPIAHPNHTHNRHTHTHRHTQTHTRSLRLELTLPGGSAKLLSLSGSVLGSTASAQLSKGRAMLHRSQSFRKAPA